MKNLFKNSFYIFVITLLCSTAGFSQFKISGKVTAEGEALIGATVFILELEKGTVAQIGIETATISGDLALMLRWMAGTCYGIGLIYDKDIESEFSQEFIKILGLWSGAIETAKVGTEKIATKIAIAQFNKRVSGKTLQAINRKVGTTIFTKYGAKRGGIAIGKLIPFGVGALVGGSFNYFTMNNFKKNSIKYYETDEKTEYAIYEDIE